MRGAEAAATDAAANGVGSVKMAAGKAAKERPTEAYTLYAAGRRD